MSGPAHDLEETVGDARDVAAGWLARQRSGEMTADNRAALRAWLEADPSHRIAYLSIRRAWGGAAALRADPQVLELRQRWSEHDPGRRWATSRVAAALVGVAVLSASGVGGWKVLTGPRPLANDAYRTAVGEQSTVKLPDGTRVTLNTDTVLRTRADKDRRLVYLERGQAFFQVARDKSHPFVVSAAGRTVTALGTAFDVRVDGGAFKVTLVEGKVRVEAPAPARTGETPRAANFQATEMTAGSQLVATAREPWRVAPANVVVETSWTRDILIFDNEPLSAVVAELNRYSDKKLVIADQAIAATPVSGTFRPGDVDSFVRTIQAYRLARGGADTPEAVQLHQY